MKKLLGVLSLAILLGMTVPVSGEDLIHVPFNTTPEEKFVIDPDTGVLLEYTGTDVDVVIPNSIEGVTVTGIDYNAFDVCRDYTNTDVLTNRKSWVPIRTLVIPETVEKLSDGCFSYCQQLEMVLCYAPLASSGMNTFEECRNLESVYFVNGISKIDKYSFYKTESLKNLYYGTEDVSIDESAFYDSGIENYEEPGTDGDPTMEYLEKISQKPIPTGSPEPEEAEVKEPTAPGAEGAVYLGNWKGISMAMGEDVMSLADVGAELKLMVQEDGTLIFEADGEQEEMIWEVQGDKAVVSGEGMDTDMEMYLTDGELHMGAYGMEYILIREEAAGDSAEPEDP
ncbi:MAG: leucine-rich repeat protein, partial [Eubacteriales bacterium]|nr:leucine-rich repeat protein [Eubacteriales bacterium]